jgi:hypothetical protein
MATGDEATFAISVSVVNVFLVALALVGVVLIAGERSDPALRVRTVGAVAGTPAVGSFEIDDRSGTSPVHTDGRRASIVASSLALDGPVIVRCDRPVGWRRC